VSKMPNVVLLLALMLIFTPATGEYVSYFNTLTDLDGAGMYPDNNTTFKERFGETQIFSGMNKLNTENIPKGLSKSLGEKTPDYLAGIIDAESRLGLLLEEETTGEAGSPAGLDTSCTDPVSTVSYSSPKGAGGRAPICCDFLSYLEKMQSDEIEYGGEHALGYIPGPVDLSHNTGKEISVFNMQMGGSGKGYTLPKTYQVSAIAAEKSESVVSAGNGLDLRVLQKVSDVENQERCGSCWAFSTYSSLESTLLPEESWDFSENNMKNRHGYDFAPCMGGNSLMATAYLSRWDGPVPESTDPYNSVSSSSPANLEEVKHVQDVWFIPSRSGPLDNENIKMALMEEGALYSTLYWNDDLFSKHRNSYFYGGSASGNHAVTIVGWDDSYDRTNFERLPAGNGAYIVKNSWGDAWGDGGFFYVSYYDTRIGRDNALFMAETTDNYQNIYQYDPLGWVVSYGSGSETEYFANIFTSAGSEDLRAVSFYTAVPDATYQVSVYLDSSHDPTSGRLAGSVSGTIPIPGYHTIKLDTPIRLAQGQEFAVVVKITTPGYQYPVAMEYPYSGYSSRATARAKESYVSSDGNRWTDITTIYPNSNVCLKAFTNDPAVVPTPTPTPTPTTVPTRTPTPEPTRETDDIPPSVTIISPGSYSTVTPGSAVKIRWSSSDNSAVAGVSVEYSTDGKKSWNPVGKDLGQSGSVDWMVPEDARPGVAYIRVTAVDTSENSASEQRSVIIRTGSADIPSSRAGNADADLFSAIRGDRNSGTHSLPGDGVLERLQGIPGSESIIAKRSADTTEHRLSDYSRIFPGTGKETSPLPLVSGSRIPSSILSQWKKD